MDITSPLGTQIFWMIAAGLVVGYVGFFLFRNHGGIKMVPSTVVGVLGAVIVGLIAIYFRFEVPMGYAVVGSIVFLFLCNVFYKKKMPKTNQ